MKDKLDAILNERITSAMRDELDAHAAARGVTRGQFVREALGSVLRVLNQAKEKSHEQE